MQKRNFFKQLREARSVRFVLLLALLQSIILEAPVQAGIPCEVLVRDLGSGTKKVLQTVRYARIPGLGRFKKGWDPVEAEKRYAEIPDTPEGRREFIDKFRADGLAGKTTLIDSMVALRILHPQEKSRQVWEIFTNADLVVTRKRLQLNPFYLLAKVSRHLLKNEKLDISIEEQMYLNGLVFKGNSLYLNKITYPRRIANVDAHLVSLVEIAAELKAKQGDPVRAIIKFMNTFNDKRFQRDLQGTLLDVNYGLAPGEIERPEFKPFKSAVQEFLKEISLKDLEQKQYLIEFIQGVSDPEKYFGYAPPITPLEIKGFNDGGVMGLLEVMRKQRGTFAAIGQFKKAFVASMLFRGLVMLAISSVAGQALWNTFGGGNTAASGAGAAVNSMLPNPYAVKPPTEEDNEDSVDQFTEAGNLYIFMPGLLDDQVDPQHPERNPSPCDPNRKIRNRAQVLRQSGRYATDGELLNRNPDFRIAAVQQIQDLSDDPQTGCRERVQKVYAIDQIEK